MMVVWLHCLYVIPGAVERLGTPYFGSSGVDLFFVISGFIMVVTTADKDVTPSRFFCLRLIRIAPLYWAMTLVLVACAALGHSYIELDNAQWRIGLDGCINDACLTHLRYAPAAIVKSLLFIPYRSPEFPGGVWPILLQGWTLNYEMFFYALFALSLAPPSRFRLPALVATLGLLVVAGKLFGPFTSPLASTYSNPMLLEFAAGMILAQAWMHAEPRDWRPYSALLIVLGFYAIGSQHSRYVIMSGAFIIVACCLHPRICAIKSRPLLELGNASYSIYLTHQFVLAALAWSWMRVLPRVTWASTAVFVALALALCAVTGVLCYRYFERPLTDRLRAVLGVRVRAAPRQSA
jgi:exopolysaccharide production protein ExoZ